MKIVFMGTPVFADYILRDLIDNHEVLAVVTRQDTRSGRGKKLTFPPVKFTAIEHDIPVYQYAKLDSEFEDMLHEYKPDVVIVVAYGKIIPATALSIPKYGFINVHASLLPLLRGAAPIHHAILNGFTESGVSIMKMDAGLDTGDVYKVKKVDIDDDMTTGELHDILMKLGSETLEEVLNMDNLLEAELMEQLGESTYASKISKEMSEIDWSRSKREVLLQIRGLNPYPAAHTYLNGKRLKIFSAEQYSDEIHESGKVIHVKKDYFTVSCADGLIRVNELQLMGKKKMNADVFLRGYKLEEGIYLC